MKLYEILGFIIGIILTGVCAYFTHSPLVGVIVVIFALIGEQIDKAISKKQDKK